MQVTEIRFFSRQRFSPLGRGSFSQCKELFPDGISRVMTRARLHRLSLQAVTAYSFRFGGMMTLLRGRAFRR